MPFLKKALVLLFLLPFTSLYSQEPNCSVYFDSGSSKITTNELIALKKQLTDIDTTDIVTIKIVAYTDHDGSVSFNRALAEKRARAVKQVMEADSTFKTCQFKIKAVGELSSEIEENASLDSLKAENRRVDIFALDQRFNFDLSDTLKVGDVLTLGGILFHGGSQEVLKESYPVVRHILKVLLENPDYAFTIQGHIFCPHCGTDGFNEQTKKYDLSLSRAKVIHDLFVKNGVKDENLDYEGLKGLFPLGKGDKFDRRIELKITRVPPS